MFPSQGLFNPAPDDWATLMVVTAFCSIALYNFIELNAIILTTFKRRSGLYFWSFLVSTYGVALYAIGLLLRDLGLTTINELEVAFIIIGWICMVTGQSIVLFSRLHLVMRDKNRLRIVLAVIVVNGIICHVPTAILAFGGDPAHADLWTQPRGIYERIEVTLFFVQETLLSGIYIYKTSSLFRVDTRTTHGRVVRRLRRHLIWVNVVIIVLNVTILALEYTNFYNIQAGLKGLVYSVKLKLEFEVLNGLIELTGAGNGSLQMEENSRIHRNYCCCDGAGGLHAGISGGIYDGTDPRSTTVDFETFNEVMISRRQGGDAGNKSERAESAYEVHIFADATAGEQAAEDDMHLPEGGLGVIKVCTETEVSTTRVEDWENMIWPLGETLDMAGSRPVTRGSRGANSCRQSSEIEFASG